MHVERPELLSTCVGLNETVLNLSDRLTEKYLCVLSNVLRSKIKFNDARISYLMQSRNLLILRFYLPLQIYKVHFRTSDRNDSDFKNGEND